MCDGEGGDNKHSKYYVIAGYYQNFQFGGMQFHRLLYVSVKLSAELSLQGNKRSLNRSLDEGLTFYCTSKA